MAANFENFLISLDFPINFRKSHQILKNYLKSSESYGQKPLGGGVPKDPPGLNRVNSLVLKWERNFEVTFGIHLVLVFQINVLESYLDIYPF